MDIVNNKLFLRLELGKSYLEEIYNTKSDVMQYYNRINLEKSTVEIYLSNRKPNNNKSESPKLDRIQINLGDKSELGLYQNIIYFEDLSDTDLKTIEVTYYNGYEIHIPLFDFLCNFSKYQDKLVYYKRIKLIELLLGATDKYIITYRILSSDGKIYGYNFE